MKVTETNLPGALIIEPQVFGDDRGFFIETYSAARYADAGIASKFVQDNHSRSGYGVLRGLHYQLKHSQGKLVRVVSGAVFDVAVDVRWGSPSFGQSTWVELTAENKRQFWIPPGFAHGFVVTSAQADFEYKCTDYYHQEEERSIVWNDPDLKITWPVTEVELSTKDSHASRLKDIASSELPHYKE
ncbi:dTDP-4-dehydrorhamnose 3,5-epimerase [Pseudomonadales bacterium]|nr:dTDP-4-dehydrorhamnose 3,5-epimerase [Pseudomonadales bacterium]